MASNDEGLFGNKKRSLTVAISAAVVGVPASQAQEEREEEKIEEVVVTATKREANLQDTAISVTAFPRPRLPSSGSTSLKTTLGRFPAFP